MKLFLHASDISSDVLKTAPKSFIAGEIAQVTQKNSEYPSVALFQCHMLYLTYFTKDILGKAVM